MANQNPTRASVLLPMIEALEKALALREGSEDAANFTEMKRLLNAMPTVESESRDEFVRQFNGGRNRFINSLGDAPENPEFAVQCEKIMALLGKIDPKAGK